MIDIGSILNSMVTVPQWYLLAIGIISAVASFTAFLLADHLNRKRALSKMQQTRSGSETTEPKLPVVYDPVLLTKSRKTAPPVRQHYWYYVSGVSGRFATLREALSASGVQVPVDKMLDWKKLSSDTRSRIKRVKLGEEQPELRQPQVVASVGEVQVAPRMARPEEQEDIIRKPIGDGAFVTFRKKRK